MDKTERIMAEWSEEDNKMIDNIVEDLYAHTSCSAEFDTTTLKKINWLKSLKDRYWKPSDEQMWALSTLANIPESASDTCKKTAQELLEQLKKLTE